MKIIIKKLIVMSILFCAITLFINSDSYVLWRHLESDHFRISYRDKPEALVNEVLSIAEQTYEVLSGYFGYLPGSRKIAIVLKDEYDYPDGRAWSTDYKIEISYRNTPFEYRYTRHWIRTLIAHELSHIYSLQQFNFPFFIALGIDVTSFDIAALFSARANLGHNFIPKWFVEGMAQIGAYEFKADFRDPFREMILKDAFLNEGLLTLEAMSHFEGDSLNGELVYNQGFDFLLFLIKQYPHVAMTELCRNIKQKGFSRGFLTVYGKETGRLYDEWLDSLSPRYGNAPGSPTGRKLFDKKRVQVFEIATAKNEEYVIANWPGDFLSFNLFKKENSGKYKMISDNTGRVLKTDRKTGSVWFNKLAYNYKTDTYNYDIFKIEPGGAISRNTTGSRSIAFDVVDDHLFYAGYENCTTQIVLREPDGSESVLYVFPPGISVYSLSVLPGDTILLDIGERDGIALLADGEVSYLLEGYDIVDPVYAGDNRIVFVSTIDGSPQVYWANRDEALIRWYRTTGVDGGARYPVVDIDGGALYYSLFEDGNFVLCKSGEPFPEDIPVDVSGPGPSAGLNDMNELSIVDTKRIFSNLISPPIRFFTGMDLAGFLGDSALAKDLTARVGVATTLYNAPGDFSLDYYLALDFPFEIGNSAEEFNTIGISTELAALYIAGDFTNNILYALETSIDIPRASLGESVHQYLQASSEFPLFPGITENYFAYQLSSYIFAFYSDETDRLYHDIAIFNRFRLSDEQRLDFEYDLEVRMSGDGKDVLYVQHIARTGWSYYNAGAHVVDPAGLGEDYFKFSGDLDFYIFNLPYTITSDGYLDDYSLYPYSFLMFSSAYRKLLFNSRMSAMIGIDFFTALASIDNDDITAFALPYLDALFSDYPNSNVQLVDALKATLELRFNPFVNIFKPAEFVDRGYLGIKGEAGAVWYFTPGGLTSGYPISVDVTLSHDFYINSVYPSTFFVTATYIFMDISGALDNQGYFVAGFNL